MQSGDLMKKLYALMYVATLGTGFGALALYLGYDTVVIGSVLGLCGTIAGYIVGKKTSEEAA